MIVAQEMAVTVEMCRLDAVGVVVVPQKSAPKATRRMAVSCWLRIRRRSLVYSEMACWSEVHRTKSPIQSKL
jgi:hypothetical protein